jgi:hypothetical protein
MMITFENYERPKHQVQIWDLGKCVGFIVLLRFKDVELRHASAGEDPPIDGRIVNEPRTSLAPY